MPECQNCSGFVTPDFVRVFGSNEQEVFGCPACVGFGDLNRGEGAFPDRYLRPRASGAIPHRETLPDDVLASRRLALGPVVGPSADYDHTRAEESRRSVRGSPSRTNGS